MRSQWRGGATWTEVLQGAHSRGGAAGRGGKGLVCLERGKEAIVATGIEIVLETEADRGQVVQDCRPE